MVYDFLQIKEDSKAAPRICRVFKRYFLKFYFRVRKANKVFVKKVEGKMLSRCVTHLIFITKANLNLFKSLINNYHLSHKL